MLPYLLRIRGVSDALVEVAGGGPGLEKFDLQTECGSSGYLPGVAQLMM